MRQNKQVMNEKGNVFLIILIAVVLFAALIFTVSRSFTSDTSNALSKRETALAIADITDYGQKLARGVNRIRRKGASENDICFANDNISTINNTLYSAVTDCSDEEHTLFMPKGGAVKYRPVDESWLDTTHIGGRGYGEWMFTSNNAVIGVGGSGSLSLVTNTEIIGYIGFIKQDLCEAINEELGITGIPNNGASFAAASAYNGTFSASGQINVAALDGQRAGCFENSAVFSGYIFYQVLVERNS